MIDPSTIINGMDEKDKAQLQQKMQEVNDRMTKASGLKDKMQIIRDLIDDAIKAQEAYEKTKSNPVERPVVKEQPQG